MKVLHWMDTLCRFRENMRYRLASTAILMVGALLMLGAIGFIVAGGFLWLSTQVESYAAAFIIAGVLFFIGAIVIAVALGRNNRRKSATPAPLTTPESDAQMISDRMVRSALAEVAEAPFQAAFVAVALGVIVGLLRSKKSP
jgi:hypothetical protein